MKQIEGGKGWISCRDVLWCLVFSGFAINFVLRSNLNIAIIAMVAQRHQAVAAAQCGNDLPKINVWSNASSTDNVTSLPPPTPSTSLLEDRLTWNEYEQGLSLASFYWLFWTTHLPGGLLARRYGTKMVFGCGTLVIALLGFLLPYAARSSLHMFIVLRIVQGFAGGFTFPSAYNMTAKWNSPNERSRFTSAYIGGPVGAALTYPLCGALINWFGWEAAFYVTSVLGVIWCIVWYFLAFDSPQEHPRISDEERNYVVESLAGSVSHGRDAVPWKAILTSGPVWTNILAEWGISWSFITLLTQTPSYFNYVHGWNVGMTGILSGVPQMMSMVVSYSLSFISDWLLRTNRMSTTNVRKMATFVCTGAQAVLILALAFSGCHEILAIVFMIAATSLNGAISAGPMANFVDMSPNYASVLSGFGGMISTTAGHISPIVVGKLTNDNQTIEQWRLVFVISTLVLTVTGIWYMIFGTSKIQPWNNLAEFNEENAEELKKLRPKRDTRQGNENTTNETSMADGVKDGNVHQISPNGCSA